VQSPGCRDWGGWKEDKFGQKKLVLGGGKKTNSWIIHIRGREWGRHQKSPNVLKKYKK